MRLECIEGQKEQLTKLMYAFTSPVKELKAMVYSDMPKGGCAVEYGRLLEAMGRLESMELIENTILGGMVEAEKKIDAKLKEFEGIEYKVAYLVQVKGYTLQQVADELKYSPGYIQNISAKVNKKG